MNIAVISVHGCPCIPPGGVDAGGMNVYVRQTSDALAQLGHSVTVYSRAHSGAADGAQTMLGGRTLEHVDVGDREARKEEVPSLLDEFTERAGGRMTAGADSARGGPPFDVIAAHYWFSGVVGMSLAERFGLPLVFSYHTMASTKLSARPAERESEQRLAAERVIAERADALVVWTRAEAKSLVQEHGVARSRIVVSPPGIDCEFFAPMPRAEARRELGLHDAPLVLFVGRLDAFKGVNLLLETFALARREVPEARLLLAGGGSDSELRFVDDEVARLGIGDSILRLGLVAHEAMPSLYSAADVMLAPSYHETFGLAVLEAAACGLPTVASDVDGLRAIVRRGETGYLVRGREARDYAGRVAELLLDGNRRRMMGNAARGRAERRNWAEVGRDLALVYGRVVADAGRR